MVRTNFSTKWKASKSAAKQRKYQANAPAHIGRHFMGAPLSADLRKKHSVRAMPVRKGDKVKVQRGQFKGHVGKIDRADVSNCKVFITGAEVQKRDGTKAMYPIHPSNVVILELELADKKRSAALERKKTGGKAAAPKTEKKAAAQTQPKDAPQKKAEAKKEAPKAKEGAKK